MPSEFRASLVYTEKPYLKVKKENSKKNIELIIIFFSSSEPCKQTELYFSSIFGSHLI